MFFTSAPLKTFKITILQGDRIDQRISPTAETAEFVSLHVIFFHAHRIRESLSEKLSTKVNSH